MDKSEVRNGLIQAESVWWQRESGKSSEGGGRDEERIALLVRGAQRESKGDWGMGGDKRGPAGCHPSILQHRVTEEERDEVGGESDGWPRGHSGSGLIFLTQCEGSHREGWSILKPAEEHLRGCGHTHTHTHMLWEEERGVWRLTFWLTNSNRLMDFTVQVTLNFHTPKHFF